MKKLASLFLACVMMCTTLTGCGPKYEKFSIYLKRAGKNSLYFYLLFSNSTITSSSWIWM